MSRLYVRVMTGFYTHRKTAKLKSKIGTDAFWVPPRIWAYAAEHQPDGDLSSYSSEEIAELIGCSKHASSILQALKDSGFVGENGKIHDWEEHNGYHSKYSERAKKAADARWGKEKSPTPSKEQSTEIMKVESGDKHCYKHDQAMLVASSPRFQKPSMEEVKNQAAKVGLPENEAEKFFYFYESKGWMVGKTKMSSWTIAMSGWKARLRTENKTQRFSNLETRGGLI